MTLRGAGDLLCDVAYAIEAGDLEGLASLHDRAVEGSDYLWTAHDTVADLREALHGLVS